MKLHHSIECPKCRGKNFTVKYQSTYVYSYKIELPEANQITEHKEALPFLFDNRDKIDSKQYIECEGCKAKFPCELNLDSKDVDFTILRKAIRGDHAEDIGFWG